MRLRLYMITIPGLEVKADWRPVHDLLLDEFPKLTDVLPTTVPETLLIVYRGRAEIDAWLHGVNDAVLARPMRTAGSHREERTIDRSVG